MEVQKVQNSLDDLLLVIIKRHRLLDDNLESFQDCEDYNNQMRKEVK